MVQCWFNGILWDSSSAKRLHRYGKSYVFSLVNQRTKWPLSTDILVYNYSYKQEILKWMDTFDPCTTLPRILIVTHGYMYTCVYIRYAYVMFLMFPEITIDHPRMGNPLGRTKTVLWKITTLVGQECFIVFGTYSDFGPFGDRFSRSQSQQLYP